MLIFARTAERQFYARIFEMAKQRARAFLLVEKAPKFLIASRIFDRRKFLAVAEKMLADCCGHFFAIVEQNCRPLNEVSFAALSKRRQTAKRAPRALACSRARAVQRRERERARAPARCSSQAREIRRLNARARPPSRVDAPRREAPRSARAHALLARARSRANRQRALPPTLDARESWAAAACCALAPSPPSLETRARALDSSFARPFFFVVFCCFHILLASL